MASFQLYVPKLTKIEAGYQKHPADKGNYNSLGQLVGTNFGISARFYEGILRRPPTEADMRALTKAYALSLMKKYFWDDVHGDLLINQSVAEIIADHAINGGEDPIGDIVQMALNRYFGYRLTVDGDIGPKTAAAINAVNQAQLFTLIKKGREAEYRRLGGVFMNGWLDRLTKFVYIEKKKLSQA